MAIEIRAYLSPTLALLALDWDDWKTRADFLGFAIKRAPGFWSPDGKEREPQSWLPTVERSLLANREREPGAVAQARGAAFIAP